MQIMIIILIFTLELLLAQIKILKNAAGSSIVDPFLSLIKNSFWCYYATPISFSRIVTFLRLE